MKVLKIIFFFFKSYVGWVLGSLEILGNPAGLLRNVRSGLTDSFMLPYEGLTRGPAAFVAGVTSGTSSLLKHLSAGWFTVSGVRAHFLFFSFFLSGVGSIKPGTPFILFVLFSS